PTGPRSGLPQSRPRTERLPRFSPRKGGSPPPDAASWLPLPKPAGPRPRLLGRRSCKGFPLRADLAALLLAAPLLGSLASTATTRASWPIVKRGSCEQENAGRGARARTRRMHNGRASRIIQTAPMRGNVKKEAENSPVNPEPPDPWTRLEQDLQALRQGLVT